MTMATGRRYYHVRSFSTLLEMLKQSVDHFGPTAAFRFRYQPAGPVVTKSYQVFLDDVNRLGTALMALPLENRRLALWGKNSYAWALAYYATINGAGVVVPLDPQLPEHEIEHLIEQGHVDLLFFDRKHQQAALQIQQRLPQLKQLVYLDTDPDAAWPDTPSDGKTDLLSLLAQGREALQQGDQRFLKAVINPDVLASLVFTSGTTARPKGVMLSQRNLCSNIRSIGGILELYPGERLLSILPLHHTFENTAGFHFLLYSGGCIHFNDSLRAFLKNMQEWRIQIMIAVPRLFENVYEKINRQLKANGQVKWVRVVRPLVRALKWAGLDIRKRVFKNIHDALGGHLRGVVVGAAALDREIIQTFTDFGIDLFMGYGLTEGAPVVSCCHFEDNVIGSVGPPLPDILIKIDMPDKAKKGTCGEVLTKSTSVMLGYENNPEETARALTADGWLRTGDIGYLDRRGCLHLTGRLKSMIVLSNGKKAFPEEIEARLNQPGFVVHSLVWGQETEKEHPTICALLQLEAGVDPGLAGNHVAEHIRQVNQLLPAHKRVQHYLYTTDDLLQTTTLKVRRQEQEAAIDTWLKRNHWTMRQAHGRVFRASDAGR